MFNRTIRNIASLSLIVAAYACKASDSVSSPKSTEPVQSQEEQHLLVCETTNGSGHKIVIDRSGFDQQPGIPVVGVLSRPGAEAENFTGRAQVNETAVSANFGRVKVIAQGDGSGSYTGSLSVGAVGHPLACRASATGSTAQVDAHMMTCTSTNGSGHVLVYDRQTFDQQPGIPVTGSLRKGSTSEDLEGRAQVSETELNVNFGHVKLHAQGDGSGVYSGKLDIGAVSHTVRCIAAGSDN